MTQCIKVLLVIATHRIIIVLKDLYIVIINNEGNSTRFAPQETLR